MRLPADDAARRSLEALAAPEPDSLQRLSPAEAEAAAELPLSDYFAAHVAAWRDAQVESGAIKSSSRQCERDHVRSFSRWDAATPPPDWPADMEWRGCPLRYLSPGRLREFFVTAVESGNAGTTKPWRPRTATSCWTSLRGVMSAARRQGVIADVPRLRRLEQTLVELCDDAEDAAAIPYSDEDLGRIYAALEAVIADAGAALISTRSAKRLRGLKRSILTEMRTALVLAANAGPRPADLFRFEFERQVWIDRKMPEVVFRARKTKKLHRIPLADVAISHLKRLRTQHGCLPGIEHPLFPHLINLKARRPLDTTPYRRCTKLLRTAAVTSGLDGEQFPKPWHAVRKSCTTRFNAHGISAGLGSVGKLITHGKDADVASQSYDNPLPTIVKAVQSIDWPAEFTAD